MYCTKCGRKLEDGEVCTCTKKIQAPHRQTAQSDIKEQHTNYQQSDQTQNKTVFQGTHLNEKDAEWAKEKGTQAWTTVKEICGKMLQVLKKPVTQTAEMAEDSDTNEGLRMIVAKTVVLTVIVLIAAISLNRKFQGYIQIPFGNLLVMMLAATLGSDWLEVMMLRVFNGIFGGKSTRNAMYAVVGTRAVYDLAVSVITVVLFKLISEMAFVIGGALFAFEFYVEFASYIRVIEMDENKKAVAFFIAKLCAVIIAVIVVGLFGKDIIDTVLNLDNLGYYWG